MAVVSSSTWDVAAWPQGQKKAQTGRRGGRVQAWSTPCVQHLLHTHQPWLGLPCLSWIDLLMSPWLHIRITQEAFKEY